MGPLLMLKIVRTMSLCMRCGQNGDSDAPSSCSWVVYRTVVQFLASLGSGINWIRKFPPSILAPIEKLHSWFCGNQLQNCRLPVLFISDYRSECHSPSHSLQLLSLAPPHTFVGQHDGEDTPSCFIDQDYVNFTTQGSETGYNYLDPNFYPASWTCTASSQNPVPESSYYPQEGKSTLKESMLRDKLIETRNSLLSRYLSTFKTFVSIVFW